MSRFLVLALLLLASGGKVMGISHHTHSLPLHTASTSLRDSCEMCTEVVQDAENYIADPKTQDTVVTFLLQNVCPILPEDASRTCTQEARVVVAQAVASMQQDLPPTTLCAYMGACTHESLLLAQTAGLNSLGLERTREGEEVDAQWPVECPLCKMVMTTVSQRLKDPEARKNIYDAAIDACNGLGESEAVAKCCSDVDQVFVDMDALMDDFNPAKACEVLQFCAPEDGLAVMPVPEVMLQLKAAAQLLAAARPEVSSDNCDACMSVIAEADAALANPDNQKQMKEYVKQGCKAFESFKDDCKEFVEDYFPMAVGIVLSYLQPELLCAQLGYCKAALQG